MCLSTAYYNKKEADCVAAQYVDKISVDGNVITLVDVMGSEMHITGRLVNIDLTGGSVIIDTSETEEYTA